MYLPKGGENLSPFWQFANGSYRIVTKNTGGAKCLAVKGALTDNLTSVIQYTYGKQQNDEWWLENAYTTDKDGDGIVDAIDYAPTIPYRAPVILLHGRTSNSEDTWGIKTNIPKGQNDEFEASINATAKNGKRYTAVDSQKITGFLANPGGTEKPVYLGNELKSAGYKENINLFAFNYPNEDAVIHSAKKLEAYITNLANSVRTSGTTEAKSYFYKTRGAYTENDYTVNLIGHSMGGLVSRYYIENLGQDDHVDKLITIDTPHWGSGLGDTACNIGNVWLGMHKLCDHDLRAEAKIFWGTFTTSLNCNAITNNCYNSSYTLTNELNYLKTRSTKYYAIAGIDFLTLGSTDALHSNNFCFEIPKNITSYSAMAQLFKDYKIYFPAPVGSGVQQKTYLDPKTAGDNIVDFYSQIGWTENSGTAPSKRIQMEKIFVTIDTDGGNGLSSTNHFHGKMQQRKVVTNQVKLYLS